MTKMISIDDRGAIMEAATKYLYQELCDKPALSSPNDTREYLMAALDRLEREQLSCLFLDVRHRVTAFETLFYGTIDGATVYPREIVKRALQLNAAAVIIAHNHPSGVAEPSMADQAITRRIKEGLALLDIRLLDHFVIGDGQTVSMAERGMI